jgi:glycosyltransferase involved in cell wall biosynthesis
MSEQRLSDSITLAHWHSQSWGGAEYLVSKLAAVLDVETVYTIGTPEPDDPNPYGDVQWVDVADGAAGWVRKQFGRAGEYALWEDVDWRERGDPDILLTSGGTTRAVITPDDTLHVNYCHSPPRWLYDLYHDRKGSLLGHLARPAIRYLRLRDQAIDSRVDSYLANSPIIQRRLWKYQKRDSTVLYPPLELDSYYHEPREDFLLHLGRLDTEKGIDAIVDAFEGREEQLLLAGGRGDADDELMGRIRRAPTIEYLGFVTEERKYELLATCRAVVFNGINEDFGIVPVEANASHKPCLVRDDGFPGLFVEDGHNGLVHDGTARGIENALDRIEEVNVDGTDFESLVEPFSLPVFERRLRSFLAAEREEMNSQFETPDLDSYGSLDS